MNRTPTDHAGLTMRSGVEGVARFRITVSAGRVRRVPNAPTNRENRG